MSVIRALRRTDSATVLDKLQDGAGCAYAGTPSDVRTLLAGTQTGTAAALVVVTVTGDVIATAIVSVHGPVDFELSVLWVAPEFRRRGIARAMLAAMGPLWWDSTIVVRPPALCDQDAVAGLLRQFGFKLTAAADDGALPGLSDGPLWRTKRIRRTIGRASLVPV